MATPYSPSGGSLIFSLRDTSLKKACGICMRMPAPSPVLASHPQAPRWFRLTRMVRASRMILWDFFPLMLTTKPTPQESCSYHGSYRPCFIGKQVGPVLFALVLLIRFGVSSCCIKFRYSLPQCRRSAIFDLKNVQETMRNRLFVFVGAALAACATAARGEIKVVI